MNDNVRTVFDMLGVEPGEEFQIILNDNRMFTFKFKLDESLQGYCFSDEWCLSDTLLKFLLNGTYKIIKLPKKKKLRDLTPEDFDKWHRKNCGNCNKCIFNNVICEKSSENWSWINHKDLYSDKFLNQEIEVEE